MNNFITISEFLKSNSNIPKLTGIYSLNSKLKKYWKLGSFKDGSVHCGNIQVKLDPENMFVKVENGGK